MSNPHTAPPQPNSTPQPRSTPPAPRWAVRLAHIVPLCVLPSSLWRVALVLGLSGLPQPAGIDTSRAAEIGMSAYILSLSAITEGLALLTIGLVRPWGEVFPRWIPVLGGRTVPIRPTVTVAGIGAVALTLLWAYAALNYFFAFVSPFNSTGATLPHGGAGVAIPICYAPLLAWGPLLGILTIAYHRRRTRPTNAIQLGIPATD